MSFTEFYCDATNGSNLNSGSTTSASATYTSPANGGWNSGTGVFTPVSGNPSSTVNVGDFASVYLDAATVAVFVARVTAVDSTTITLSTTAKMGTAPTTGATGFTVKVGGAWKGPNAGVGFPFGATNAIAGTLTNVAGDEFRVTMLAGASFAFTSSIATATITGPVTIQGATSAAGDGGRAVFTSATSGVGTTFNGSFITIRDIQFTSTASAGTGTNLTVASSNSVIRRCVVNGARASGISNTGALNVFVECEAYDNNKANSVSNSAGFSFTAGARLVRCISHDNTGSNGSGFNTIESGGVLAFESCIADTNGQYGFASAGTPGGATILALKQCDSYNNASHGIFITPPSSGTTVHIENCNLVKNGTGGTGYGIAGTGSFLRTGVIKNCGFGAGTQANATGTTNSLGNIQEEGSVTYASNVTPWNDAPNGDFTVTLAAAKAAGRGTFLETAASYAGTVGAPCIGAGQPDASAAGGGLLVIGGMTGGNQRT